MTPPALSPTAETGAPASAHVRQSALAAHAFRTDPCAHPIGTSACTRRAQVASACKADQQECDAWTVASWYPNGERPRSRCQDDVARVVALRYLDEPSPVASRHSNGARAGSRCRGDASGVLALRYPDEASLAANQHPNRERPASRCRGNVSRVLALRYLDEPSPVARRHRFAPCPFQGAATHTSRISLRVLRAVNHAFWTGVRAAAEHAELFAARRLDRKSE